MILYWKSYYVCDMELWELWNDKQIDLMDKVFAYTLLRPISADESAANDWNFQNSTGLTINNPEYFKVLNRIVKFSNTYFRGTLCRELDDNGGYDFPMDEDFWDNANSFIAQYGSIKNYLMFKKEQLNKPNSPDEILSKLMGFIAPYYPNYKTTYEFFFDTPFASSQDAVIKMGKDKVLIESFGKLHKLTHKGHEIIEKYGTYINYLNHADSTPKTPITVTIDKSTHFHGPIENSPINSQNSKQVITKVEKDNNQSTGSKIVSFVIKYLILPLIVGIVVLLCLKNHWFGL